MSSDSPAPPDSPPPPSLDRRTFLRSSLGAAGFVGLAYWCAQPIRRKAQEILEPAALSPDRNARKTRNEHPITNLDISFIDDGLTMRVRHRDFRIHSVVIHQQEFSADTLKNVSGPEGIAASFVGADLMLRSTAGDILIDGNHLCSIARGLCAGSHTHHVPYRVEGAKGQLLLLTMMLGATGECDLSFTEVVPHPSPLEVASRDFTR